MAKWQKRYGIVDLATGELFEGVITPWRRGVGGKWVRVFQDSTKALLLQHPELHGQSHRVLIYLTAVVEWGNHIPTSAQTAVALGLQASAASRAYGELIRAGFILKRDGTYYLSPLVAWKGSEKQLDEAYQQLFTLKGQDHPALASAP